VRSRHGSPIAVRTGHARDRVYPGNRFNHRCQSTGVLPSATRACHLATCGPSGLSCATVVPLRMTSAKRSRHSDHLLPFGNSRTGAPADPRNVQCARHVTRHRSSSGGERRDLTSPFFADQAARLRLLAQSRPSPENRGRTIRSTSAMCASPTRDIAASIRITSSLAPG